MSNIEELNRQLEYLKKIAYLDGNFKVVGRDKKLIFEIRTKEKGHNEPHFHVKTSDFEASYSLNSLKKLAGAFPNKIEKNIIKWAKDNLQLLKDTWNELHGDYRKVI